MFQASSFSEGLAFVILKGGVTAPHRWLCIDKKGTVVFDVYEALDSGNNHPVVRASGKFIGLLDGDIGVDGTLSPPCDGMGRIPFP